MHCNFSSDYREFCKESTALGGIANGNKLKPCIVFNEFHEWKIREFMQIIFRGFYMP